MNLSISNESMRYVNFTKSIQKSMLSGRMKVLTRGIQAQHQVLVVRPNNGLISNRHLASFILSYLKTSSSKLLQQLLCFVLGASRKKVNQRVRFGRQNLCSSTRCDMSLRQRSTLLEEEQEVRLRHPPSECVFHPDLSSPLRVCREEK